MHCSIAANLDFMEVKENQADLKKNHNMYYDIQGQLHICKKKTCIFSIWTSNRYRMFIQRIERDDNFFDSKMKMQLRSFYNDWLLPELVNPRLQRNMPIRQPDLS